MNAVRRYFENSRIDWESVSYFVISFFVIGLMGVLCGACLGLLIKSVL